MQNIFTPQNLNSFSAKQDLIKPYLQKPLLQNLQWQIFKFTAQLFWANKEII
jgi:hypothetical protein